MQFIVTVRLPIRADHDPRQKQRGICPLGAVSGALEQCTDVTGAHHSFLAEGAGAGEVQQRFELRFHVTRVEEVSMA